MALQAVVFDIGETLVDESGMWTPWRRGGRCAVRIASPAELPARIARL